MSGSPLDDADRRPTLVVGASGRLGGRIARLLLADGTRVRILARPGANVDVVVDRGAERVAGDLRDPASLRHACAGAGAVVVTANTARRAVPDTPGAVDDAGVRALVDAAVEAGAHRFLHVSADVARIDSPHEFLRAKASAELHLSGSGLDWTILAPDMFMESWITAIVLLPAEAGDPVLLVDDAPPHAFVSEVDVAVTAVAALRARWTFGERLAVGGPEVLAWEDVVDRCSRALQRPINVRRLTMADAQALPESGLAMLLLSGQTPPHRMRETADRLGVPLTTLSEFLRRFTGDAAT
ncbi:MAG: NAD(P)H-binding protein [Chloroflexi bacterium]|jgi:NADH dehydrogenase|nr:NAD(P)H-binding protein [Chloroflexota bacterium]